MPYIKLLTALTALALLTACGGGTDDSKTAPTATDCTQTPFHADCSADTTATTLRQTMCLADTTIDPSCTDATGIVTLFCEADPFNSATPCVHDDYDDERQTACLANIDEDPSCDGATGIVTLFCEADPFSTETACGHTDYDDDRETACLADTTKHSTCVGVMGIATVFCEADPFNTATACVHDDYDDERQTACLANIDEDPSCDVTKGIATLFCEANPFDTATPCMHGDYADERQTMCLANIAIDDSCRGTTGIATLFCEANPFDTATACGHADYADERQTMCLANIAIDDSCRGDRGIATLFCEANPFDTATPCMHGDYADERQTMCLANIAIDDSCRGTTGIATVFCEANPFDTATACGHADYADERQTMCLANIAIDDSCRGDMGIATVFCKANLFDTSNACMADTYLPARIADCIMAGNAGESKCDTVSTDTTMNEAITACLTNPFATACESVTAFSSSFALARTNRVSFCETGDNDSNTLCMGATLTNLCEFNLFSTACTGQPNTPDLRVASCLDANNMNKHSTCTEVLLVNNNDYLASFGDTPPPATLLEAVADTAILSHFVSIGVGGIDRVGLTGTITPLTLSRAGDAMDGVTYVEGTIESRPHSFVGLLPSTDLGAPLPSTTADATWAGSYYARPNRATNDITFNIDFGAGTIDATDTRGNNITTFDLDFTATGVITGSVRFEETGLDDTAPARGLIGEQGLVGGFANTDGGQWGVELYGGFVAEPSGE